MHKRMIEREKTCERTYYVLVVQIHDNSERYIIGESNLISRNKVILPNSISWLEDLRTVVCIYTNTNIVSVE